MEDLDISDILFYLLVLGIMYALFGFWGMALISIWFFADIYKQLKDKK